MNRGNENAPAEDQGATSRGSEYESTVPRPDRRRNLQGLRLQRSDGRDLLVQTHPRTGAVRLALTVADASKPAGERIVRFVFVDPHELAIVRDELDRALAELRAGRQRNTRSR